MVDDGIDKKGCDEEKEEAAAKDSEVGKGIRTAPGGAGVVATDAGDESANRWPFCGPKYEWRWPPGLGEIGTFQRLASSGRSSSESRYSSSSCCVDLRRGRMKEELLAEESLGEPSLPAPAVGVVELFVEEGVGDRDRERSLEAPPLALLADIVNQLLDLLESPFVDDCCFCCCRL